MIRQQITPLFYKLIIFIFLFLNSNLCHATVAADVDPSCRLSLDDPFDRGFRMNSKIGDFKSICMDSNASRLPEVEFVDSSKLRIHNLKHLNRFWTLNLKHNSIEQISLLAIHFDAGVPFMDIAHVELLVELNQPATLFNQEEVNETATTSSLVLSWENFSPVGHGLELIPTITRNFPIGGQVMSLEQNLTRMREHGTKINAEKWPLILSPLQRIKLIQVFFQRAAQRALTQFYILKKRNCATELIDTIDLARLDRNSFQPFQIFASFDPVVGPLKDALEHRGILIPGEKHRLVR